MKNTEEQIAWLDAYMDKKQELESLLRFCRPERAKEFSKNLSDHQRQLETFATANALRMEDAIFMRGRLLDKIAIKNLKQQADKTAAPQHTPTPAPWHTVPRGSANGTVYSIYDNKNRRLLDIIASFDEQEDAENAAFIIRARNSHEALAEALNGLNVGLNEIGANLHGCGPDKQPSPGDIKEARLLHARLIGVVRAALAAAVVQS